MAWSICPHGEAGPGGWSVCSIDTPQSSHWDGGRGHVTGYSERVPADDGMLWEGEEHGVRIAMYVHVSGCSLMCGVLGCWSVQ